MRRSKKLIDLRNLYAREPRQARRRQTWQEMLALTRQWVAASGGKINTPRNQGT